jgi:hypothetical protein
MTQDYKSRVRAALNKVAERELKEISKLNGTHKKRKHAKPEKLVEKACMEWMRNQGWSVQVIEAKATYNPRGFWSNQSVKAGTCDCIGTTNQGISVAIEFKAESRLKTFRKETNQRQIDYIVEKIEHGAFACVTDSVERLKEIHEVWTNIRAKSFEDSIRYLKGMLP